MSFDSRLSAKLRQAVDGYDLREDDALALVKATQPTEWADFTVVALDDLAPPRSQQKRAQRVVGALAACALLAGAVALPMALRSRPQEPTPRAAGQAVTTGYRSTVTVRIAAPPPRTSTGSSTATPSTTTRPVTASLGDPVVLALASSTRDAALRESHLRSDDPGINFGATTDAAGDVLSLTVITPIASDTTTLARNWAGIFGDTRRQDARRHLRELTQSLNLQVTRLHQELQRVDKQLVRMDPATYKNLLHYDGGNSGLGPRLGPPPVPEHGSVKVLNLAFERIQILASLTQAGTRTASLRITGPTPDVFDEVISQTPAVLIEPPHRDSNTSRTLIPIGLLAGGLVLASSAFVLGRRSRGLSLRKS